MRRTTTTAAGTPSSGMRHFVAHTVSTPGTLAASTTASSTTSARSTWSVSPRPRAPPFSRTKTRRAWSLASTWTSGTSVPYTPSAAGKNGSSCARCSGTAGRGRWSRQIERPGTPSSRMSAWLLSYVSARDAKDQLLHKITEIQKVLLIQVLKNCMGFGHEGLTAGW